MKDFTMSKRISKTISILGGSNSVLLKGYSSQIIPILSTVGIDAVIRNYAIGANTSLRGLYTANTVDFSDVDIVIIEYFINDGEFFSQHGKEIWIATFEGVIRYLQKNYPNLQIIPLVLGHRNRKEPQMLIELEKISQHYDLLIANFDENFRNAIKDENVILESYKDSAHYKVPQVSYQIALFLAQHVVASMFSFANVPFSLPKPLSVRPFDCVETLNMNITCAPNLPRVLFSNSRYSEHCVAIPAGESIDIDVTGRLLLICYVSEGTSCDLIYDDGKKTVRVHTLHKKVAPNGTYPFLLRSAAIFSDDWANAPQPARIRLSALHAKESYDGHENLGITPYLNMQPNMTQGDQAVFLSAIMMDTRS